MRVLFSSSAGYGHIHPLVPLAHALQGAGHDVAFATRPVRRGLVERAGFTFFEVGGDIAADPEYQQYKAQIQAMGLSLEAELFAFPRTFGGISARLRTPLLIEIMQEWRPAVVVREAGEFGALIAAEHLGLPHATVATAASLRGHAIFERELATFLDPVRRHWGLAPDPARVAPTRYLHLAYSPPTFALHHVDYPGETSIPPTTHFVRPDLFDSGDEQLPAWIEMLPDQPTVYVTLGTEVNSEPTLYPSVMQTLITGLRDLPINLIVTLGRGKDPADFGPQPPNVHIEPYIPQSLLLPRCDLMVMHGGSNSLLAAIDLALPTVIVPLIADQFFNADVAAASNLSQAVQLPDLTPATIRAAVQETLANPLYKQTAIRLQSEMHALPTLSHAVTLIERLAATKTPILNPTLPT